VAVQRCDGARERSSLPAAVLSSASVRLLATMISLVGWFCSMNIADGETIRVAPATEIAREADPRRFTEPHLAVHPSDGNRLLVAAFSSVLGESLPDIYRSQYCSAFASRDGGRIWTPTISLLHTAAIRKLRFYRTAKPCSLRSRMSGAFSPSAAIGW